MGSLGKEKTNGGLRNKIKRRGWGRVGGGGGGGARIKSLGSAGVACMLK